MGDFTQHDKDLGFEPIGSIDDFVSPNAKRVAAEFGLTLDKLPQLLKLAHDYQVSIERSTAPQNVMADGAYALAAKAVMLYEQADRGAPFKFVIPGQDDVVTELYDHPLDPDLTPRGRNSDRTFAKLYERNAHRLLNAPQPQLPSQTA